MACDHDRRFLVTLSPEQKKASFVKRARVSAYAGKWLSLAGIILGGIGLFFAPIHWGVIVVMGIAAVILQAPRQIAWRSQNDVLELISLAAMPLLLGVLSLLWLKPTGVLSLGVVLQALGGFFITLGVFHMLTRDHTLKLADEIEQQP